jgi:hypothetical protein
VSLPRISYGVLIPGSLSQPTVITRPTLLCRPMFPTDPDLTQVVIAA